MAANENNDNIVEKILNNSISFYDSINLDINGDEVSEESKAIIERLHNNSLHKFNIPTYEKQ
mgnify:CR=1 FL=1